AGTAPSPEQRSCRHAPTPPCDIIARIARMFPQPGGMMTNRENATVKATVMADFRYNCLYIEIS
ncbi:hypothetical protein, partial [Novacetimonas pomaceti]|uniref:hypothetical protein n=1 Tax=Novacetimonas pomaceti TaxID=2021998 RepID=UPI001C2D9364